MPLEREGVRPEAPAISRARQAARRPAAGESWEELRKSARARRADVAVVSSYLRALRRLGEVPLTAARPEMPH